MSIFKRFESSISSLVEGTFSRVFRSQVRPVELARKLAKEMEQHRTTSVANVYVPNHYRVHLSQQDYEQLSGYQPALTGELESFLLEHSRSEQLTLAAAPIVELSCDQALSLGSFAVETLIDQPAKQRSKLPRSVGAREPLGRASSAGATAIRPRSRPDSGKAAAYLSCDGRNTALKGRAVTVGRSKECDLTLSDVNVSRQHARFVSKGGQWLVEDLNSTNGVSVNGRKLSAGQPLNDGDLVEIGPYQLTFKFQRGA